MEKVQWKIEGMTCANCALTIHKYLEKEGLSDVKVNAIGGEVSFELNGVHTKEEIAKGIETLGYTVAGESQVPGGRKKFLSTSLERFWFCFPFTVLIMLNMLPGVHIHFLMNPWVQLALCLPVYIVGMSFFGKSAIKSLRNGMPNMNVLIALGATAAFVYSLYGTLIGQAEQYMFYETAAAILTLVFLGNYLEDASLHSTQRALNSLAKSQKVMANMIAYDNEHHEHVFAVDNSQLKVGDLILIKSGEQVPMDCKILWGDSYVNEAIVTGESAAVHKYAKDKLIGGSLLQDGMVKAQVTAVGGDTVLSGIIDLVKQAQGDKPPVQQLADKISAIFVPVVIGIAVVTLGVNWIVLGKFADALMRSIAVLVIACPCAMGLATPAAIAVGLGRGAKTGILFRNAITRGWKCNGEISWSKIEEMKGLGMRAVDRHGNKFLAGSYKLAEEFTDGDQHSMYVIENGQLVGWIDVKDEIRPEAKQVVDYLHSKNIKTFLLSGDRSAKCEQLAKELCIDEVIAEQTPEQKLKKIAELNAQSPTAMIGDGINDAPALAQATVGVSMSEASQIAMQTAQVVLMGSGLKNLPTALGLGRHTYLTIRQNLFWAFFYNIIAIPVAAFGFLTPTFGALVMGFSDVVLAVNSVRLFVKKVV